MDYWWGVVYRQIQSARSEGQAEAVSSGGRLEYADEEDLALAADELQLSKQASVVDNEYTTKTVRRRTCLWRHRSKQRLPFATGRPGHLRKSFEG